MRVHSLCQTALWGVFFVSLLGICSADDKTLFEVVGAAECADCNEYDIKSAAEAFSGLSVSVDCKLEHGETKRMGDITKLDEDGKFKISVSQLHQDCYVQLHSAAAVPCIAHNGVESTKIVLKSQTNGIQTFGPSKNPQFSTATCASKTSWHFFKHPPFPYTHPWKKKFFKPPVPVYKPPVPEHKPPVPVYKPPVPEHKPPVPVYKPKPPVHKPPVPVYKPKPPVHKPPVPVYKPKPKPKPKPPVHKPPVPVHKPKPPVPVYKPKPPVYKPPVTVHKPPVPKPFHPFPKFKFPPKHFHHPKFGHFHHPKFGHFPPLPPHHP
ncbi:uncharacterized protein LOC142531423 isoform X2 [Primulina tabacum]|uniref:uncharacterized protein LOC142531423 isoform X2 n=1 Tax=Primulina tabacum TaxID=48773 RepID=UPI003F59C41E